jgi:uncharacterized membrane protein YkvA (DUF1232 family)
MSASPPGETLQARIRKSLSRLKTELYALYLAYQDPRLPWYARACAACVAGYAFSPIDLIPDFIPLLGYLDDLIILPLGVALAVRLIPPALMAECRAKAARDLEPGGPGSQLARRAAYVIVLLWICLGAAAVVLGLRGLGWF